ncbi:putative quinol monooxygenase [Nocardia cyriacigeorgica]|uniref:putative quinol monooxygenase n=1 Tax=Nocardia cyriacigeorgica TaxID=135487 RepID=UPI0013D5B0C7|nr:antibiotic biosynthesis monooxygenase [Nocardia cyriacigeorgica]NEW27100.1 hypothetical protein [Nocardia cyriacigeorgica]
MTVLVLLECHTKPDRTEDCLAYLRGILADTRGYEGHVSLSAVRNIDDPAHLVLVEQWARLEDQKAYLAWRAKSGALDEIAEFMAAPPSITVFDYSAGI